MTAAGRVLPSLAERRLADRLTALDGEISALYAQLRTAQLGVSTVTGALPIRDSAGVLIGIVGTQPDGTPGVTVKNASPPPQPNSPDLAPFSAGLGVGWNGDFPFASRPANFRNVEVYLGA